MNRRIPMKNLFLLVSLISMLLISACNQAQSDTFGYAESKESIDNLPSLQSVSLSENNKQVIRETFDSVKELQDRIRSGPNPDWVVKDEKVNISLSDYVLAKKNRDLIYALNQVVEIPSDEALLQDMVTKQLTVNYAKQSGIVVTPEEVSEAVHFQKAALDEADPNDENHQLIRYMMENRIRITGMTTEEFWNSDEVYEAYETSLYISKFLQSILTDESMKGMDSYQQLQDKLFNDFQKRHPIKVPDFDVLFQKVDL
ncbi:hypothetical protein ACXFAU_22920 [Paenibacillus glucanolyticus]|uniref:hypothetical protein n=1 Tax=Paenibacillus glucanolyticus TaxID=59843 RepID=UPI0030C8E635